MDYKADTEENREIAKRIKSARRMSGRFLNAPRKAFSPAMMHTIDFTRDDLTDDEKVIVKRMSLKVSHF